MPKIWKYSSKGWISEHVIDRFCKKSIMFIAVTICPVQSPIILCTLLGWNSFPFWHFILYDLGHVTALLKSHNFTTQNLWIYCSIHSVTYKCLFCCVSLNNLRWDYSNILFPCCARFVWLFFVLSCWSVSVRVYCHHSVTIVHLMLRTIFFSWHLNTWLHNNCCDYFSTLFHMQYVQTSLVCCHL